MDSAMKLQSAIKRKIVLRETFGGSTGHKVKSCKVKFIEDGWYNFIIDGYDFDCKWDNLWKGSPVKFFFRNNVELEKSGYCYIYGVDENRVSYASSLHFGSGTDFIRVLWVLGEVLSKKRSMDFRDFKYN